MPTRRTVLKGLGATALLGCAPPHYWTITTSVADVHDPALLPATRLLELIRQRKIGCRELLQLYLQRIERFNPELNAVVWLDAERAISRAEAADRALARGDPWGPLHGLPMTVKDTFEIAGMPTTAGNPLYRHHIPTHSAGAVQRLTQAGAVIFGRSNVPRDAGDWQSYNELYGTTRNPWDLSRTPGGSSGGAAAALAAGLTALELGSDFGGSVRIPAHFTGIYGHKSSFGLIPYQGHIPPPPGVSSSPDMAVVGPLARSPADLALALEVLITVNGQNPPALLPVGRQRLQDYRIAAWLEDPYAQPDQSIRGPLQQAIEALRQAKVRVEEQARPALSLADIHQLYRDLLQEVLRGYSPPDTRQRQQAQRQAWAAFFQDYDLLLTPVAQTAAFGHDHSEPLLERRLLVNGRKTHYTDSLSAWISPASAAYLPATTVPIGLTETGLPVGIQIIGPYRGDRITLDFAQRMTGPVGGFMPPPGY